MSNRKFTTNQEPVKGNKQRFHPSIAVELKSVEKAVLLDEIVFWCNENRINGINQHHGLSWTFNSARSYSEKFPYLNRNSVKRWLNQLEAEGWIFSGNFNKRAGDQTKWYTANVSRYNDCVFGMLWSDEDVEGWIDHIKGTIGQNDPAQNIETNGHFDPTISQNDPANGHFDPTLPTSNTRVTTTGNINTAQNDFLRHSHPVSLNATGTGNREENRRAAAPQNSAPDDGFFDWFWSTYNHKLDRAKCEAKASKLKASEKAEIRRTLPWYVQDTVLSDAENEPGKAWRPRRKNPATYLNQKTWADYADATGPRVRDTAITVSAATGTTGSHTPMVLPARYNVKNEVFDINNLPN